MSDCMKHVTAQCKAGTAVYMVQVGKKGEEGSKMPIVCTVQCVETFHTHRAVYFRNTVENFVKVNWLMKEAGMCCKCNKCCKIPVCWTNRFCCYCRDNKACMQVDNYLPQYLDAHTHDAIDNDAVFRLEAIDDLKTDYTVVIDRLLKRNPCFCKKCGRCDAANAK